MSAGARLHQNSGPLDTGAVVGRPRSETGGEGGRSGLDFGISRATVCVQNPPRQETGVSHRD